METIKNTDWKDKKVLVRLDLNTSIVNGKPDLSPRILAHAKTVQTLANAGAAVIVLAHQGRPGKDDFTLLGEHAKLLQTCVTCPVSFIDDVIGQKAQDAIRQLKSGNVLVLDNVRLLKEEMEPKKNPFAKTIIPLIDAYVNDAFSVSHRAQASVVAFADYVPCYAGPVLAEEVEHLRAVADLKAIQRPCYCVFGGAKPEENLDLMESFLKRGIADTILCGGFFGQLCLIAKGVDFGAQNKFFQAKDLLSFVPRFQKLIKTYGDRIITPIDIAVDVQGKRQDLLIQQFPSAYELYDIGPQTQEMYVRLLAQAKTVFFKGPLGFTEKEIFAQGTKKVWSAISQGKAISIGGGGDTVSAVSRLKIPGSFTHISLSGGAMDEFLIGKKLPGLVALEKGKKNIAHAKAKRALLPEQPLDKRHRYDVITVGSAVVDTFINTDAPELVISHGKQKESYLAYPAGEKIAVHDLLFSIGGGGTNAAACFARLGLRTAYCGCLGKDENANKIMTCLRDYGISFIGHYTDKYQTGFSVVLNSREKHRTIFTYKGANDYLAFSGISKENIDASWFYFCSMLGDAAKTSEKLAAAAKTSGAGVTFNPSMYQCKLGLQKAKVMLSSVDILVFNKEEAQELSKKSALPEIMRALHACGPKIICITDESAAIYCSDGFYLYTMTPHKIKIVERTGAGDAFGSAFTAGYLLTKDIEQALQLGLAQAESIIQHYGAKEILLTTPEIQAVIKKNPGKIVKERLSPA